MPRLLVRTLESNLASYSDWLSQEQIARLYDQPLVRRVLANGEVRWFALTEGRPSTRDIFNPKQAAATQLGLSSQLLHADRSFANSGKLALAYLRDSLSAALHNEVNRLFVRAERQNEGDVVATSLRLSTVIGGLDLGADGCQQYVQTGLRLGNILAARYRGPMFAFSLRWLQSDFEGNERWPENEDSVGPTSADLEQFAITGCSSENLLRVLSHRLQQNGPSADFQSEAISSLLEEHSAWVERRRIVHAGAETDNPICARILDLLDGRSLTKEELAEQLGLAGPRGLSDNKSTKDGKVYTRVGPLDQLKRTGQVAKYKTGGFYRPDRPPEAPRRRSAK